MTDPVLALSLLDQPPEGQGADTDALLAAPAGWPAPPAPAAYHQLLGEIVTTIAPHTEADPIAILTQLLVAFGAAVGRGAWFTVEATRHHANEFMLLVGDSSKARKGSSWDHVRRLIAEVDPTIERRILTGLSSGEGLIWAVRDPTSQDPGIPDQRLLIIEPEFASVLKTSAREISTLSPTLRCAWDGRPLAMLTRTAPARSTHAHIALIGHITQTELRRHTTQIELSNGYLNRILLVACRRQRLLPEGGHHDPLAATGLTRLLTASLKHAQAAGQVRLDKDARERWHDAYRQLARPLPGVLGQITARAEAHTIRLALIYALTARHHRPRQPPPTRSQRRETPKLELTPSVDIGDSLTHARPTNTWPPRSKDAGHAVAITGAPSTRRLTVGPTFADVTHRKRERHSANCPSTYSGIDTRVPRSSRNVRLGSPRNSGHSNWTSPALVDTG